MTSTLLATSLLSAFPVDDETTLVNRAFAEALRPLSLRAALLAKGWFIDRRLLPELSEELNLPVEEAIRELNRIHARCAACWDSKQPPHGAD